MCGATWIRREACGCGEAWKSVIVLIDCGLSSPTSTSLTSRPSNQRRPLPPLDDRFDFPSVNLTEIKIDNRRDSVFSSVQGTGSKGQRRRGILLARKFLIRDNCSALRYYSLFIVAFAAISSNPTGGIAILRLRE